MRPLICILGMVLGLLCPGRAENRDELYNGMGRLKGQVFFVDTKEASRDPAAGIYLLFRRADCRRCVIGVRADIEGRYEAFVAAGVYRVFCDDPESRVDIVRKGQPREVTVRRTPNDTKFDIELEIPREWRTPAGKEK